MSEVKGDKTRIFSAEVLERAQKEKHDIEDYGATEKAVTYSGIQMKPVYSPDDIAGMSYDDIPLPGRYPYTRGFDPTGYRANPWRMLQFFGFSGAADTKKRWEYLRSIGYSSRVGRDDVEGEELPIIRAATDLPSERGYDPDEPEARGRVGGCGFSLSTMGDMKLLLDGTPLDRTWVLFVLMNASLVGNALYVAYAETRGYSTDQLLLRGHNVLYHCCQEDVISFPPEYAKRLMTENIYYIIKHMPKSSHTSFSAYDTGEMGATGVQQVAFTFALAIDLMKEGIKVGLDPNDLASGFYHHSWVGLDLFEEVAKIRCQRRLWAKIMKERFGCKSPSAVQCRGIFPFTAGSLHTAQEPLNNIIRVTIMALAAVLSGAEGLHTTSYDEDLGIPTEEAVRIAIRTQQILYHETSLPYVTDPLGGSYYVEWLTNKFEEEAVKYLDEIERQGGFFKCWENGFIRSEIERTINERQHKISHGEIVVVGQNKYRLPPEQQPEIAAFPEHDPEFEKEAIARVREWRSQRDNERTNAALAKVRDAAKAIVEDWPRSCGILMPSMISAFKDNATLGEVHRILREVFGYAYVGV
jgi:methylmalonyl-CoA mutase N-terminal domain/subunit